MSSGVAGGGIGRALTRSLERRYGKVQTCIGAGAVGVLGAFALAILYSLTQPVVTESDLTPSQVQVSRFYVRRSSLDIWSGDRVYTARPRFWRPAVQDEVLERALASNSLVTIWLFPGESRVYGLSAGDLHIPTSAGVAEYMSNRFWFCMVWVGLLVLGLCSIGQGLWLYRRGMRVHEAT